jgi:hypothetical protein
VTPTERTAEQTFTGTYWGYDGTPGLGVPPRLYNQIAATIATQQGSNARQLARLFALVNVAMADAGIAAWESKYYYQFWRPIGGLREADVGMGPTGTGDGSPQTIADPKFLPLGAPASNLLGRNATPPFPRLSIRARNVWWRVVSGIAALLSHGQHRIHFRIR